MDINEWNAGLARWGGAKPPGDAEKECVRKKIGELLPLANSRITHGEFLQGMREINARDVTIIAVRLELRIVEHSDGYFFRGQQ